MHNINSVKLNTFFFFCWDFSLRITHQTDKVPFQQAETLRRKLRCSHQALVWHDFEAKGVDAPDKCFAKMPESDRVDAGIRVSAQMRVSYTCISISDACCCLSSHGGVVNDSDTHPLMVTEWTQCADQSAGWHALRRRARYDLGQGFFR